MFPSTAQPEPNGLSNRTGKQPNEDQRLRARTGSGLLLFPALETVG